jgi:hypothetical protein
MTDTEEFDFQSFADIPAQLKQSAESDTVHMWVEQQDFDGCSPNHDRGLLSPVFNGTEVSYSKSNPPIPAALLAAMAGPCAPSACGPAALRPRQDDDLAAAPHSISAASQSSAPASP